MVVSVHLYFHVSICFALLSELCEVGIVGQGCWSKSRSNAKNRVLQYCYLALRSKLKVEIKVKGQGQGEILWCSAVNIRGSALLSAAKRNRSHYQSKVFVCVSAINGQMITRMQIRSRCHDRLSVPLTYKVTHWTTNPRILEKVVST